MRDDVDWDAQPLGKMADSALGIKLGVGPNAVAYQRNKRGIVPFNKRQTIDWDAQPLGKTTDIKLARDLGVSVSTVSLQRNKRGIVSFHSHRRKGEIDWNAQALGQMSDVDLSIQLKTRPHRVSYERRIRGIQPFHRNKVNDTNIDWDAQPLGEVSDRIIADKLGVSLERVRDVRVEREIEPCAGQFGEPPNPEFVRHANETNEQQIIRELKTIRMLIEEIYARLYEDNGAPRLDPEDLYRLFHGGGMHVTTAYRGEEDP